MPGRPLAMHDIFMECVQHEDRLMHIVEAKASVVPPSKRILLPKNDMKKWSPAALYAFGRQIVKRSLA
jgi:hypothetical protein